MRRWKKIILLIILFPIVYFLWVGLSAFQYQSEKENIGKGLLNCGDITISTREEFKKHNIFYDSYNYDFGNPHLIWSVSFTSSDTIRIPIENIGEGRIKNIFVIGGADIIFGDKIADTVFSIECDRCEYDRRTVNGVNGFLIEKLNPKEKFYVLVRNDYKKTEIGIFDVFTMEEAKELVKYGLITEDFLSERKDELPHYKPVCVFEMNSE